MPALDAIVLTSAIILSLGTMGTAAATAAVTLDCRVPSRQVIALPASAPITVQATALGAWLEIEEAGADVTVTSAPAASIEVTVPPRYGRFLLPVGQTTYVHIARSQAAESTAGVSVALRCNASLADQARVEWYRLAAKVSSTLLPVSQGIAVDQTLGAIAEIETRAPDAAAVALVAHLRAQAWFTANRTADSVKNFADAESAWLLAEDPSRALAARVGRIEELNRAGRYREALALAAVPAGVKATDRYFVDRIGFSRCLAHKYLGELRAAATCYTRAIELQQAAGERAESSGLILALADTLRDLGQPTVAEHAALRAYAMADGPDAPILRGRAQLLLYDLLLDRGEVPDALNRIEDALDEFGSVHATRWEANAMLRAAWLYAQFGAVEEARAFVAAALERLSERDAPARVAAAELQAADLNRRSGENATALVSAHAAEAIYLRLDMSTELDACRTLIAELELDSGNVDAAAATIGDLTPKSEATSSKRQLVEARIAIARREPAVAQAIVEHLRARPHSLPQQVELASLQARLLALSGKTRQALQALRGMAVKVRVNAESARNPLLADLLVRQLAPLRAMAIELIVGATHSASDDVVPSESERLVEIWDWLQLSLPPHVSVDARSHATGSENRFDAAVANELLADPVRRAHHANADAARDLLSVMTEAGPHLHKSARLPMLQSRGVLQSMLGQDKAFVTYLDGNTTGALLWMTDTKAWLIPALVVQELRMHKARLLDLIASPGNSVALIRQAADALSFDLLATAPIEAQRRTLLVDAGGELAGIPWTVLRWRGSDVDLIENTTISLVQPQLLCCDSQVAAPLRGRVFVTLRQQSADAGRPELPTAAVETQLISSAVGNAGAFTATFTTDRDAVFDALKQPGDWIHFAMHGQSLPNRIGFSGIWLAGKTESAPFFLNAIDALSHDVASELVVLGTCQSALRARDGVHAALSFADAISRAGARNVIAALWPISDSAAALWVPAFYKHAATQGQDEFAEALRDAQLRLRESRNFRHPYYWSSLIHLQQLESKQNLAGLDVSMAGDVASLREAPFVESGF
ncbi:MAG: CHAT domain-containing protein [Dokdonella sp.]